MLLLHAQGELGDVVYVELPEVGKAVKAKETFGVVESVKVRSAGHACRGRSAAAPGPAWVCAKWIAAQECSRCAPGLYACIDCVHFTAVIHSGSEAVIGCTSESDLVGQQHRSRRDG